MKTGRLDKDYRPHRPTINEGPEAGYYWVVVPDASLLPPKWKQWARVTVVGRVMDQTETRPTAVPTSEPVLSLVLCAGGPWECPGKRAPGRNRWMPLISCLSPKDFTGNRRGENARGPLICRGSSAYRLCSFDRHSPLFAHANVQHLDRHGEGHGEVDVTPKALHARRTLPPSRSRPPESKNESANILIVGCVSTKSPMALAAIKHHDHGENDRRRHDRDMFHQADRRNDGIQREDDIQQRDLDQHHAQAGGERWGEWPSSTPPNYCEFHVWPWPSKQAASDQDQVTA